MSDALQSVIENLQVMRQLYNRKVYLVVLDANGVVQGYSIPEGERPMLEVGAVFEDPSGAFD